MLALLQQSIFRAKIDEKSDVLLDFDFEWILGGFWEGFGRPKSIIFAFFFDVFSMSFFKRASEGEKIHQNAPTRHRRQKFWAGLRCTGASWGKERIGVRTLQIELLKRIARKNVEIGQL